MTHDWVSNFILKNHCWKTRIKVKLIWKYRYFPLTHLFIFSYSSFLFQISPFFYRCRFHIPSPPWRVHTEGCTILFRMKGGVLCRQRTCVEVEPCSIQMYKKQSTTSTSSRTETRPRHKDRSLVGRPCIRERIKTGFTARLLHTLHNTHN